MDAKWIDFEHSWMENVDTDIEDERLIVLELWGPDGDVWKKMCVRFFKYHLEIVIDCM